MVRLAILLFGLTLSACGSTIDPLDLAACRQVVDALIGPGEWTELRVAPAPARLKAVRIDYSVSQGTMRRARYVVCGLDADHKLLAVATESGEFGEGRLLMLRRYGLTGKS